MTDRMDEAQLIAEFRATRDEDAFASLVRRHVDFVYATALRQVGDSGLAEEITQDVFLVLARKAGSLGRYQTIAGWLYQTTLNRVRQRLRSELRRQRREGIAAEFHADAVAGQSIWEPLVPLLDEGLSAMDERDRLALLLHCLEGRGFREVGELLGLGEDAARKRVNRALERLTDFFRQHGFAVPAITAGTALFVGVSAPASLVGSIVSSGLAAIPTAATLGVLMTPTMFKAGLATLLIESTFVEAPEDVLMDMGLVELFAETETVTEGYVLEPAEAQEIVRVWNETEGVKLISAPRMTMVNGRQGRISDLGPSRGDQGRPIGVSVNLNPRISADGRNVELTVLAEVGERNPEPPVVDNLVRP